jgi:catalase
MALKNLNRAWTLALLTALIALPGPSAPGEQPTAPGSMKSPDTGNEKLKSLEPHRKGGEGFALTTNQGVRIADDQNSLRAGARGPTLLEDFILREKSPILTTSGFRSASSTRGSAAHGYFPALQKPESDHQSGFPLRPG